MNCPWHIYIYILYIDSCSVHTSKDRERKAWSHLTNMRWHILVREGCCICSSYKQDLEVRMCDRLTNIDIIALWSRHHDNFSRFAGRSVQLYKPVALALKLYDSR